MDASATAPQSHEPLSARRPKDMVISNNNNNNSNNNDNNNYNNSNKNSENDGNGDLG